MSLVEHLDELRSRIIYSLLVIVSIAIAASAFYDRIMAVLTRPLQGLNISGEKFTLLAKSCGELLQCIINGNCNQFALDQLAQMRSACYKLFSPGGQLIFTHPTEAFFAMLKIALFTGLLLGAPFVLYQLWRFVVPALFRRERRYFYNIFVFGTLLFYIGVFFCFFVVLPLGMNFLIRMGGDYLQAFFTIGNYLSFVLIFLLIFGLVFELPLVILVAVKLGLVTSETLRKKWRHVVALIFIVAAILTPTVDPFSMSLMAAPLLALYGVSLLLAHFAQRRAKLEEKQALETEGGAASSS